MIIVTGGAGFIGANLIKTLNDRGEDDILVVDDLTDGRKFANLVDCTFADYLDREDFRDRIRGGEDFGPVAAVFHQGACTDTVEQDGRYMLDTNYEASKEILGWCQARKVPLVYASSAAVYGEVERLPITEDAPTRPLSAYGADKLGSELHARVAGAVYGVPTIGFRFFNVFGPRQDPRSPYSGVISIFCDRFARGAGVDVYGDGGQTRDFIAVGDIVAGLLAGMEAASTDAPVLNLCTGRATSVLELARTIAGLCGAAPAITHRDPRAGEIRHSVGSAEAARAMLGLGAPQGLAEGLAEVVAWLRADRPGLAPAT